MIQQLEFINLCEKEIRCFKVHFAHTRADALPPPPCVRVPADTRTHAHTHTYARAHARTHTNTRACAHSHACPYVLVCVRMRVCARARVLRYKVNLNQIKNIEYDINI